MSAQLIQALRRAAAFPHHCDAVEVIETHLSWVLLAGPYAYKIKKPVNLGFADYSTLARRRQFCREELRLNRRFAPQLYHHVVAIAGTPQAPRIDGQGRVIEYAVRMARFPQDALAAHRLRQRQLDGGHFEALARAVAALHDSSPRADAATPWGSPQAVLQAMRDNFSRLAALRAAPEPALERLRRWSEERFAALAPALQRRREQGRVRECHGDLHLGNLVLLDGRLTAFDGIEFDPALRWIDTASEAAFAVMDLHRRGAAALAHRFLDAWLEASDDYGALEVLDFFLVYRAMVRAKVAALRAAQCAPGGADHAEAGAELRQHLQLAHAFTQTHRPLLVVTHGVSGSGKTTLAQALVESLGLVRLRSDVQRKRLFGLAPTARTGSGAGGGIYDAAATQRTYPALEERAGAVLRAGHGVVVDATFLQHGHRERFARLAQASSCPFRIVALEAPASALRLRVAARERAANDASEATPQVLASQLAGRHALTAGERTRAIFVDARSTTAARDAIRELAALRAPDRQRVVDSGQCESASAA